MIKSLTRISGLAHSSSKWLWSELNLNLSEVKIYVRNVGYKSLYMGSRLLYAGHRLGSKEVTPQFYPILSPRACLICQDSFRLLKTKTRRGERNQEACGESATRQSKNNQSRSASKRLSHNVSLSSLLRLVSASRLSILGGERQALQSNKTSSADPRRVEEKWRLITETDGLFG
jgi:hypothetical protein